MQYDSISFDALPVAQRYQLLISAIIPRPIAWISTCSSAGQTNLAPFSFFMGVSSDPACLAVSITSKRDAQPKDTLSNILETGEFVVHIVPASLVDAVNQSSAEYPSDVSEIEQMALHTRAAKWLKKAPIITECPVAIECVLHDKLVIGYSGAPGSSTLIVGRILGMHVDPKIWKETGKQPNKQPYNQIDATLLDPLSRMGGLEYAKSREIFSLPRPELAPR